MNIEEIREYCLTKKGVTEGFPFDESTLVFKVMGKMFLLASLEGDNTINLKCDPEKAISLREHYSSVLSGYHMNKKYWNTVVLDGSVSPSLIYEWIDHSYDEVVKGLTRKAREELNGK